MPKYSIIIPAFNAEDRLDKVLGSIRMQENVTDYEIIVVCDRCKDNTEKIAREKYGAITYIADFGNDGLSRSKGLDLATGDWVLFLDDDDWWLHEYVLDLIDKALAACNYEVDLLQFGFIWKTKGYCGSRSNPNSDQQTLYTNVWTKCFRREFIGDIRFPNVHSISDSKFVNAIIQKNPRVRFLDHPMYYYNWLRPGSISKQDVDTYGTNRVDLLKEENSNE